MTYAQEKIMAEKTKKCSKCNCINPLAANYCRKCGSRFPENTESGNIKACSITRFEIVGCNRGKCLVRWSVVNAKRVFLNDNEVTGKTEITICVNKVDHLTLRAENEISFDTKQMTLFQETHTIYKERIVEKKVPSLFATSLVIIFIILSTLLIFSGKYIMPMIEGEKAYLLVNGEKDSLYLSAPSEGANILFNVQTNDSTFQVTNTSDWCEVIKEDDSFWVKMSRNSIANREADIKVETTSDTVNICLEQNVFSPKRLLVNGGSNLDIYKTSSAGQMTFRVDTDADSYEIESLPQGLRVDSRGRDYFTLSYGRNYSDKERVYTFKVKAGGMSANICLTQSHGKVEGKIRNITLEHNVTDNNVKGMKIHVSFDVKGMYKVKGTCVSYFYYENGKPVKDYNGAYRTSDGNASASKDFIPNYYCSSFNDLIIFMPYSELEVGDGKHSLKFYCTVWDSNSFNSHPIVSSKYYTFILTRQ